MRKQPVNYTDLSIILGHLCYVPTRQHHSEGCRCPGTKQTPVASFTKEVNWRLAKCPLKTNGRFANRQLTSLVKEATGDQQPSYRLNLAFCVTWIISCNITTIKHSIFIEERSLWPREIIWWQKYRSPLAQVMACCLMAPNHYVNQCCLISKGILCHSPLSNFTRTYHKLDP